MSDFFTKNAKLLKKVVLISFMIIPFFLYYAAIHDLNGLVYALLGLVGLSMLLALKVG